MSFRFRDRASAALSLFFLACAPRAENTAPAAPPAATGAASRPNILLIVVDTLRADHLSSYGYPRKTSPEIDALAARGVRFDRHRAQAPCTFPSMNSLLTSQPVETFFGQPLGDMSIPANVASLPELLHAAGYITAAFSASPIVRKRPTNFNRAGGFDRGFDLFDEECLWQDARCVNQRALGALAGHHTGEPVFLLLHYIDPHGPYVPPPAFAKFFVGAHPPYPVPLEELPPYQLQIDPATGQVSNDIGFYATQYDREIRSLDDQIGRLLAELDARSLTRDTLIVFTADHGESMMENAYYLEHGDVPYQTTGAVPLIFALDGRFRGGRVIERPVGVIDLYATVLALTKTPAPAGLASTSLLPVLEGKDDATPQNVFMISGKYEPWQLSIREGRWKLVLLRAPQDREWLHAPERALYDIASDPHEQHDVLAENAALAASLEKKLLDWFVATPRFKGGAATDLKQLDGHTQEMLRALGYLE